MPGERDLYRILGVAADATHHDIVHAYRRLAQASHPDTRPGDTGAAGRFVDVTAAYEVLADPARRAHYDRTRNTRPPSAPSRAYGSTSDALIWSSGRASRPSGSGWVGPSPEPLLRVGPVQMSPPEPATTFGALSTPYLQDVVETMRRIVVWLDDDWSW